MRNLELLKQADLLQFLNCAQRGIEKESLRIDAAGQIAQTPHPKVLGASLTHPHITTDYSEALLEFVTPTYTCVDDLLSFLNQSHCYTLQRCAPEMLWPASMPPITNDHTPIPIAEYGSSHSGQMKTIYRRGLKHRYGDHMQAIAGLHYNFSFPRPFWLNYHQLLGSELPLQTFIDHHYFRLIRNYLRHGWLIPYFFGASPALTQAYHNEQVAALNLHAFDASSRYLPDACCLRMSKIGYQNVAQSSLNISYNSLDEYVANLTSAIQTPYAPFKNIALYDATGAYQQLNTNHLQIENEYYSAIRPKRSTCKGIRPTKLLQQHGVEYLELRNLDLNPFSPLGIDKDTILFLDVFLLFCLLHDSPPIDDTEAQVIKNNNAIIHLNGRAADVILQHNGKPRQRNAWAKEIIAELFTLSDALELPDMAVAITKQAEKIDETALTPSAQLLQQMRDNKQSYFELILDYAQHYANYFQQYTLPDAIDEHFQHLAEQSLERQKHIEAQDTDTLPTYIERYFSQ